MATATENVSAECCVVGGGPAGMMLGLLLARAGVRVTVLEKHKDFLRDFRGDTVHPSTLRVLHEIGLFERFDKLKQHKARDLKISFGDHMQPFVDLHGLKPFDYIALVPQWDLLNFLAERRTRISEFRFAHEHEGDGIDRGKRSRRRRPRGRPVGTVRHSRESGCRHGRPAFDVARCREVRADRISVRRWTCCGFASRANPRIRKTSSGASRADR